MMNCQKIDENDFDEKEEDLCKLQYIYKNFKVFGNIH